MQHRSEIVVEDFRFILIWEIRDSQLFRGVVRIDAIGAKAPKDFGKEAQVVTAYQDLMILLAPVDWNF